MVATNWELQDVPLFPLPATVLFPHALLPLHVFEPRYRQLASFCLGNKRPFAVVLLKPGFESQYEGRPPVYEVGGLGRIVRHQRLPDGRFNLLVVGIGRIAIEEEGPPTRPYRVARVRQLPEVRLSRHDPQVLAAIRQLRNLGLALLPSDPQRAKMVFDLLAVAHDPAMIAHTLLHLGVDEPLVAQRALECPTVQERLDIAVGALTERLVEHQPPDALRQ